MDTFTQISRPLHGLFISLLYKEIMRCDLHVHSLASGMCNTPGLSRVCRESYNQPGDVYARCKQLGMSLVTMTDHDSVDAAEELRKYPDFFLSEEVTCRMPSGSEMHLGVYGITDRDHVEIQHRRNDFIALVMYLTERRLFFSVNHVYSGLTGARHMDDFHWFASYAPAFEARNGQMHPSSNAAAEKLARTLKKVPVAGSDSHTIAGVAKTFTEVPGARSVDEFFAGLRGGRGRIHGVHGSYAKLTADVFHITAEMFRENPLTLALSPLAALLPLFTAGHWLNEIRFFRKWSALLQGNSNPRMLWDIGAGWESV